MSAPVLPAPDELVDRWLLAAIYGVGRYRMGIMLRQARVPFEPQGSRNLYRFGEVTQRLPLPNRNQEAML